MMKNIHKLLFVALLLSWSAPSLAREILDMAGRRVEVPENLQRIYTPVPPLSALLAVLAPEKLIALNLPINEKQARFLPRGLAELPVLGGLYGHGPALNPEEILALKPDVVMAAPDPMGGTSDTDRAFAKPGLPVVYVRIFSIRDYPAALRFLGQLLDRASRAEQLASYIEQALARVDAAVGQMPEAAKTRYYYAEGPDGLMTECSDSFHVETMTLAGGQNIEQCAQSTHMGMERASLDAIVLGRPQILIALDPHLRDTIVKDPAWRHVPAVADEKILTVPRLPFNWLDRPPSFMRALGAQWLANAFYPEKFPLDLRAETKKFYALFFNVELSDADVDALLK